MHTIYEQRLPMRGAAGAGDAAAAAAGGVGPRQPGGGTRTAARGCAQLLWRPGPS